MCVPWLHVAFEQRILSFYFPLLLLLVPVMSRLAVIYLEKELACMSLAPVGRTNQTLMLIKSVLLKNKTGQQRRIETVGKTHTHTVLYDPERV